MNFEFNQSSDVLPVIGRFMEAYMQKRLFLKALLMLCFVLTLVTCGLPGSSPDSPITIIIGKVTSGTLTDKDHEWVDHDPYTGAVSQIGYTKFYQVQATAGKTYTVTFWSSNGDGNFEDRENGTFTILGDVMANGTDTWVPSKTGFSSMGVLADESSVPFDFTILIR